MLSPSRKHPRMADFFISYTQTDRAWAEWIAWVLEEAGYETKLQAWDFPAGTNFVEEMNRWIEKAERTVLVLSPDAEKSTFVKAEWTAAFAKNPGKLLPVRVREVEPWGVLRSIVFEDLVKLDESAAQNKLLIAASRVRAKPKDRPTFPGRTRARFPADLAAVPEDDIPAQSPLPKGSRMPLSHNDLFVGRQEDLKELARQLKARETTAIGQVGTAAATGLGGIGKTQLACEFVHRYGQFFESGVFWMSFADPAAVPAEVAACGVTQALHPDYESLSLEQRVRLVEESWQSASPRLLVFDNCEEEALILRWRPRHGGARVLLTSRRAGWDPGLGVKAVPLQVLPRPASIELLRRFRSDVPQDDPILDTLADELGDLPLALHLAGSFLKRYRYSPDGRPTTYFEAIRQEGLLRHPSLQGRASPHLPTGHEADVRRTFALSFERLNPEDATDALAIALLSRAAYFAPGEPIPRALLLKTVELGSDSEASLQAEDALQRLVDLGLFDLGEDGAVVLHRLIAKFAREAGEGGAAQRAVEWALLLEANRLNEAGVPGPLLEWQPHLRAVTGAAWEREDEVAARLCDSMCHHLWMVGDLKEARPFSERALAISEKVLGPEHRLTATSLNNLGTLLRGQGDLVGARPYYERALAIWEKVLGSEHPDTALSLNNFGVLLRSQGDLAGARPYYERALAIWEKVLGPEHPDTARSLNNLGVLLDSQGDLAGARPYYERALAIREKALGPEHPDTANSLNNLGFLLQSQGDLAGAHPYFERALTIREKVLGPEHPDTALSLNNLGALLRSQGDFTGARPYFERALAIVEARLGPDHPSTKIVRGHLETLDPAPGGGESM
jgi:tetratricopeptide (TPR) repeat protein